MLPFFIPRCGRRKSEQPQRQSHPAATPLGSPTLADAPLIVRDELRVVADQRGAPTSAREIADVILDIAPRLLRGDNVWGTYHFTSGGATTWHGFASRIVAVQAALTGRSPSLSPIATVDYPTAARRPANSQLDCSLFAKVFAIGRRHWTEGVDATTKALLASAQRIDDVA